MTTETPIPIRRVRLCPELAVGYDPEGHAITIAAGLSGCDVERLTEDYLDNPRNAAERTFVEQWYEDWSKERPLPPRPGSSSDSVPPDGYYAKGRSPCHRARMLLVRSREGGYVSKNCCDCGKSMHVRPSELPELLCGSCRTPLAVWYLDGKNYFYVCKHCGESVLLASILPWWSQYFPYCGLPTGPFA